MGQRRDVSDSVFATRLAKTNPQHLREYISVDLRLTGGGGDVPSAAANRLIYTRYGLQASEAAELFGVPHLKDVANKALEMGGRERNAAISGDYLSAQAPGGSEGRSGNREGEVGVQAPLQEDRLAAAQRTGSNKGLVRERNPR